jgi:hypothetical protein
MSSVPRSPFAPKYLSLTSGNNEAYGRVGNDVYAYWDNDPLIKEPAGNNHFDWNLGSLSRYIPSFNSGDFIVISFGPGANENTTLNTGIPFHSSNGLNSVGEIFMTSYSLTNENAVDRGTN